MSTKHKKYMWEQPCVLCIPCYIVYDILLKIVAMISKGCPLANVHMGSGCYRAFTRDENRPSE